MEIVLGLYEIVINDILYFLIGLAVLVGGGELLVRSASRLAAAVGLSSLVIGLTIVSLGTSAPELAVGAVGALEGRVDAGLGNVVGSNIFNILFVLGLVAFFSSPAIEKRSLRFDIPLMIFATVVTFFLVCDHRISHFEAGLLLFAAVLYVLANFLTAKREPESDASGKSTGQSSNIKHTPQRIALEIALLITGVAALGFGAHWVVAGASGFARGLGMSELAIGLTLIAFGTSLPELVTSLVAVRRGEKGIAIGNIFGSCIFNLLVVLPVMAALMGDGLHVSPMALSFDIPVMVGATIACVPLALSGRRVSKAEGAVLVAMYVIYVVTLTVKYHVPDGLISSVWMR